MNSHSEVFLTENMESNGLNEALRDVNDHPGNNLNGSIQGIIPVFILLLLVIEYNKIWKFVY